MVDYKGSFEYRMGWHDCYMVVLKSFTASQEDGLSAGDTVLKAIEDVGGAEE